MSRRRARPASRSDIAAPEAEEVEEDVDGMSSMGTGPASPVPSISRLISSALCPGSAPRSAVRTSSRQPAASHQKATSRRQTISRNAADDCSDCDTVGNDDVDGAEEENGTPPASISRSLRRLTRAVSHTISGAPTVPCCEQTPVILVQPPCAWLALRRWDLPCNTARSSQWVGAW